MKKFHHAITVALALLLSAIFLTGCVTAPVAMELIATETPESTPEVTPTPEPTPTPTVEPTPEPVVEEPAVAFSAGKIDGRRYTNEYFNIGCELDEKWTVASAEELAALSGVALDAMAQWNVPEMYTEQIKSGATIYEFSASASGGFQTIVVNVTDASAILSEQVDMNTMLQLTKKPLLDMLEEAGMQTKYVENTKVYIGEAEQAALYIEAEYMDIPVYMLVLMIQRGAYLATINITTIYDDTTAALLENFYMVGSRAHAA